MATRCTAVKNRCLKSVSLADSRTEMNTRKEVDRTTSDLKHGSQQILSLNVFKTSTFNLSENFKSPRNYFILSMTSHLHTCTAKACARCVSASFYNTTMAKPFWCAILPSSGWEVIRVVVPPQTRSLCYLTPAAAAFHSQQDGSKSKDMVNKC